MAARLGDGRDGRGGEPLASGQALCRSCVAVAALPRPDASVPSGRGMVTVSSDKTWVQEYLSVVLPKCFGDGVSFSDIC